MDFLIGFTQYGRPREDPIYIYIFQGTSQCVSSHKEMSFWKFPVLLKLLLIWNLQVSILVRTCFHPRQVQRNGTMAGTLQSSSTAALTLGEKKLQDQNRSGSHKEFR